MARKRRRKLRQQEDAAILLEGIEAVIIWEDPRNYTVYVDGDTSAMSANGRMTVLKFLLHELGGTPCLWNDFLLTNGETGLPDDLNPRCQRERR